MKSKWFSILCLGALMFMVKQDILASGFDDSDLLSSQDYEEVSAFESQLLEMGYSTYNGQDAFTAEKEVVFEKAVKVYTNTDIFEDADITGDEIRDKFQQAHYEWRVPVYYCGETATVSIGKKYEEDEHMGIKNIHMTNRTIDYQQIITEKMNAEGIPLEESDVYFVEHSSGFDGLMAIIVHGEEKYVIPFHKDVWIQNVEERGTDRIAPETLFGFGTMVDIVSENSEMAVNTSGLEESMDAINSTNEEKLQNSWWIYGGAGVVAVIIAGGVVIIKAKKWGRK